MSGTTDPKDPKTNPPGGGNPGDPADPGKTQTDDDKRVSYDTHQKLLSEKKKEQEKRESAERELEQLRKEKQERELKELETQGKFKELAEAKDKELQAEREKNAQILNDLNHARKRQALLKNINGTVPANAMSLLPLDLVKLDADGKIDESSAKLAAQVFEKDYSFAVQRDTRGGGLPPEAPDRGGKKLTVAEWESLPPKEMRARASEVDWK
jgi:hypothetical protein